MCSCLACCIWSYNPAHFGATAFPPFPIVFPSSKAQSQTGLDEDVTTGNLTLPKLRDQLSAPELLEETEGMGLLLLLSTIRWG